MGLFLLYVTGEVCGFIPVVGYRRCLWVYPCCRLQERFVGLSLL